MQQHLNVTNNFIIILAIVVFLAALAASYILSAKAHAPIRFIANKLNADNQKAPLAAIEENIDRIMYENENLTELLTYANAAASLITTRKGALCVMPTKEEIEAYLKKR